MAKASKGNAAAVKAAGEKKTDPATNTVKVPALSVVSGREGFRRAGRAWGKEATVVKLSELTKEQVAQIKAEALLTVTEVEIDEKVSAE